MKIAPPEYRERVLLLGSNGSGKSVLARQLLAAGYHRTRCIDLKGDFNLLQDHRVVREPGDWRGFRARHVIYRPRAPYDSGRWLDHILGVWYAEAQRTWDPKRKVQRNPTMVYVDEALALAKGRHTENLAKIAVAGRALDLGLMCSSQRPVWIPVEVRSEAHRMYVFYLQFEEDEQHILKYAKRQLTLEQLQAGMQHYSFWELRRSAELAGRWDIRHMPPLPPEAAA